MKEINFQTEILRFHRDVLFKAEEHVWPLVYYIIEKGHGSSYEQQLWAVIKKRGKWINHCLDLGVFILNPFIKIAPLQSQTKCSKKNILTTLEKEKPENKNGRMPVFLYSISETLIYILGLAEITHQSCLASHNREESKLQVLIYNCSSRSRNEGRGVWPHPSLAVMYVQWAMSSLPGQCRSLQELHMSHGFWIHQLIRVGPGRNHHFCVIWSPGMNAVAVCPLPCNWIQQKGKGAIAIIV